MKIKLLLFALFFLFAIPLKSYAACSFSVNGTTNTVTSSCSFDNAIDGIDMGTTTVVNGQTVPVNSSVLKIAGGTVTIGATQQIAIGSVNLTGGSLAIIAGGKMLLNTPMWYVDTDNDGVYDSSAYTLNKNPDVSLHAVRVNATATPSTIDCNIGGATSYSHTQCYEDSDGDTYTVGLKANTTCLNTASCATASLSSASTNGAAITGPFPTGTLRNAANGADCNDGTTSDGSSGVYISHSQCYQDEDRDGYTYGLEPNTTCLNTAACATATKSSASTDGAAVTGPFTAARLRDAATTNDCADALPGVNPAVTAYSASSFVDNTGATSWDWNCVSGQESDPTQPIYACGVTGCASHYFTITAGFAAAPGCGNLGTWKTYAGAGGAACTIYVAGAGVTCPAATTSSVAQRCR